MITNLYKYFRDVQHPNDVGRVLYNLPKDRYLSKSYDEPTYLSFKIEFFSPLMDNNTGYETNFDKVPHPLFLDLIEDSMVTISNDEINNPREYYSTTQFLRDNNEFLREDMLRTFLKLWNELQEDYQWYFQNVGGLNSLMKINPLSGKRVPADGKLVLTMLEGLDQRITHLLNLYRKVAWDDTYQRWILPDMMRWFKIRLYITEFRTFHRPFNDKVELTNGNAYYVTDFLQMVTELMPTYIIEFDRCEIDLESINILPDTINIGDAEMRQLEFSIKVGNFKEEYINPMLNFFWNDTVLNSLDRSNVANLDSSIFLNDTNKGSSLRILYEIGKAQNILMAEGSHMSGTPFLQMTNSKSLFGAKGAGPDGKWGTNDDDTVVIDPTDPHTWLGNLFTMGKATVKNFVKDKIGQAKIVKIPGLGISFQEALSAIQSKNVFTLLAIGRKAVNDTVSGTMPSQELEDNFVDSQYRLFLENVANSQATDDLNIDNSNILELRNAANMALNDRGTWEKIRDMSKATDLVSRVLNEINIANNIQNSTLLKEIYQAQKLETIPVQKGIIYEGIPSSLATNGALTLNPNNVIIPAPGSQVGGNATDGLNSAELGSTDGNLSKGSTIKPSILLGNNPGGPLPRGENQLGSNAGNKLYETKSSEELGSDAGGQLARGASLLGDKAYGKLSVPEAGAALKNSIEGGGLIQTSHESRIHWDGIDIPDPGEAVDGDPIDKSVKINRPPASSNLNDKIKYES